MGKENKLSIKLLTPSLWKDVEKLFGDKGACGGCWCMFWRQEKGENWEKMKGATNKKRFHKLVKDKKVHGAIAYKDGAAVGWISFDRRKDFAKLDRAPSFVIDDAENVWSIPCFYIHPKNRSQGVSTALLNFTAAHLKKKKVKILEGYPYYVKKGANLPGAFAWVGTHRLFEKCGFSPVDKKTSGKVRMRREF